MHKKPLVSVLMTVYNREKYIAEAIKSVLASTYQNWELIIVDDCSKDSSVQIAKTFEAMDHRIKVYINNKNLGDYPNRNQAADYANGKYIKYVDADDMMYSHGLELLVFYMEQFPTAGYGLCSLSQDEDKIFPFELNPREAYQRHYLMHQLFHKAPLSSIIKKTAFEEVGGFSGKPQLGDFELWHILSQKYPIVLMPQGIVWYRRHDEQESSVNRADPAVPFKYILLAEDLINSDECPLAKDQQVLVADKIKHQKARAIFSAAKHHSLKKAIQLLRTSRLNFFQLRHGVKKSIS